nr:hypothetical protein [Streptomyces sp. SID5468]
MRSLTRAGTVVVGDGRVSLLTSRGQEIDSAPLTEARAATPPWFGPGRRARVVLEGRAYGLRPGPGDDEAVLRLCEALSWAREQMDPRDG